MEPVDATAFEGASGGMVSPVGGAGADEGTLFRFVVSRRMLLGCRRGQLWSSVGGWLERRGQAETTVVGAGNVWPRIRALKQRFVRYACAVRCC